MNPGRQAFSRFSSPTDADRALLCSHTRALAVVLLAVVFGSWLLSPVGTGTAAVVEGNHAHGDGPDSTPPSVTNGSRINATAVALTIADDHDVDESTIEAADFLLSDGSVRAVSVAEAGTDAAVTLGLDRRLNEDTLTVVLRSGATILDATGNELNASAADAFAVVENMDSVPPSLSAFSVTNATGGPATIRLAAREPLSQLRLAISGPTPDSLAIDDFEQVNGPSSWEATYSPRTDGTYGVYLENYTDTSGNTRESARNKQFVADLTPPTAVAALDLANSRNLSIAFDARRSGDPSGIAQYQWTFGDGETATGARVTHDYLPGNYTVELNVTDVYGNAATDSVTLNLTRGSGNVTEIDEPTLRERAGTDRSVSVQRPGDDTTADALVGVDDARRNRSIAVGTLGDGPPLAVYGPVSLDGLAVTLSTNRSFDLGVSLAGNGSVADAATAGRVPLAGFTVVNTVSDSEIATASLAFSVARSRLAQAGVGVANVSLLRFHDGAWTAVPTTPLGATDRGQSFRAETPGFSRFAIVATGPTDPEFAVTDATLETDRVRPGDPFTVTATVENSGAGTGTFLGALEANGTVVARETTAIGAGETGALSLQSTTTDTGVYHLAVNGTAAGTLTVAATDSGADSDPTGTTPFVVTNASVGATSVDVNQPFAVTATIENRGDERGTYTAALTVDGSVVATTTQPVPAGDSRTVQLDHLINRSGEFPLAVNGTSAGTLTVGNSTERSDGDSSGGDLLDPLSGVLGVLPLGLLRPAVLFVVAPLALVYGVLKALAIYLGY